MKKSLSIILPAYNEAENIKKAIYDCFNFLDVLNYRYEIIVIDDGSTDNTGNLIADIAEKHSNLRIITHTKNEGYGVALRDGFKVAQSELVFFTDSDRQFAIESLSEMLPLIEMVDIVIGYRFDRKDHFIRKFLSCGYNALVSFLFDLNVKDIDCAFKLFRREVFDKIKIESKHFFINTEILAKARLYGFNIAEIGITHYPRINGMSKVSLKYIPLTLRELFRIKKSIDRIKNEELALK